MCGVVQRPTKRKTFPRDPYVSLSESTVSAIISVCEETHIPEEATKLVLYFADKMAHVKGFIMESIPFALYQNQKRYVTAESVALEASVMHLAMAGSVRYHINKALAPYGIKLELGHCCDIQMHEVSREEDAYLRSHDENVYRADRLRMITQEHDEVVDIMTFLRMIDNSATRGRTFEAFRMASSNQTA